MIKSIPRPAIKDAKVLTPRDLNGLHFADKHTRLTPRQLAAIAASQSPAAPEE